MDPNSNIEEQRRIAARMQRCEDNDHPSGCECLADGARLAALVIALDGWLCSGGSKPRTWRP